MAFLQVFDRKNKAWSSLYSLEVGYSESFVLDKTTDTAKDINFIYDGENPPEWNKDDWVRIIHPQAGESGAATYNSDGTPKNHNQYIIGGIQCVAIKIYKQWRISMSLLEPIERFRGVIGEVLAFTNQTEKKVKVGNNTYTYRKKAYNHYTALERWLKITPANNDVNKSWLSRIKISNNDIDFLKSLPFGDQVINGRSLYEVLLDIYDSSTGRTPVAYFDIKTYGEGAGLPYNLDRDEYYLRFERQDGFDKDEIDLDDLRTNCKDEAYTKENSTTGIYSDVENLSTANGLLLPAQRLFIVPEVDTDERSTKDYNEATSDSWILRTPYPIKRIVSAKKLEMKSQRVFSLLIKYPSKTTLTDVTDKTFEEKEYLALTSDPSTDTGILKYKEGENKIHVRGYRYVDDVLNDTALVYQIEYLPLLNPRLQLGENENAESLNQTDGQVDSEKYASFLSQYLEGQNKADLTIIKTYDNYYDFSNHIGRRVFAKNGKVYMITNLTYINRNYQYDVIYQLNEGHFRKNRNYQADAEIRKNIAIPYSDIQERKSTMLQKFKIGVTTQSNSLDTISVDKKAVISALCPQKVDSKLYPQIVLYEGRSTLSRGGDIDDLINYKIAHLAKFSFGNQIHLHYKFFDNAEAGKQKQSEARRMQTPQDINYLGSVTAQLPVLYTDYFGEVQTVSSYFTNIEIDDITDIDEGDSLATKNKLVAYYWKIKAMPDIVQDTSVETQTVAEQVAELKNNAVAKVEDKVLLKDQLEQLNENYIIEIDGGSDNDIIVTNELIRLSRLLQAEDSHDIRLTFCNRKMNKNDIIDSTNKIDSIDIAKENTTLSANSVKYSFTGYTNKYKSVIISTRNDVPLLILNYHHVSNVANGSLIIHF